MKNSYSIFLIFILKFTISFSQINLGADKIGESQLSKVFSLDHLSNFYQAKNLVFYYNSSILKNKKVSSIELKFNFDPSNIQCLNCIENKIECVFNKNNIVDFIIEKDTVSFYWKIDEKPKDGDRLSKLNDTLIQDPQKRFMRFSPTNVRYISLSKQTFGEEFNIALVDNNNNRILDNKDLISLSKTDVFFSNNNKRSSDYIDSVQIFKGFSNYYKFKLLDKYKWTFSIEQLDSENITADISLEDKLDNFKINGTEIYDILDKNEFVIFDLFSEYCSVCIKSIPKLNELNKKIKIIGLIETSQDLNHFIKMNDITYESYLLTPEIKRNFNLNGNPNYILIGKNKEILGQEYSVEKIVEIFENQNH